MPRFSLRWLRNGFMKRVETEDMVVEYGRDGDDIIVVLRATGFYKHRKYRRLVVKAWLEPSQPLQEGVDIDIEVKAKEAGSRGAGR